MYFHPHSYRQTSTIRPNPRSFARSSLYNPQVYAVADIIDTYVYRVGVLSAEFSFGAAVGLFKNVIGLVLLLLVNALARRFSEHALW